MKEIQIILVDDEKSALENLAITLEDYCPEVDVLATGNSVSEGIKLIKKYKPDLVFLDISMPPEGTGFDVLEAFPNRNFHVVFVTAYEEYSLRALKNHAFDYILKPLDYQEVVRCIEQFKHFHAVQKTLAHEETEKETLSFNTSEGIHLLKKSEILYLKAEGSYVKIFMQGERSLMISKGLKSLEPNLDNSGFMRVHRSYIVNLSHIQRFIKSGGGYLEIGKDLIPVSDNFREKVIAIFS